MGDYVKLPRSALSDELWRNKDFGCLLWFLLSKADSEGVVTFTAADIELRFGISRQRLRTMINKILKSGLATNKQPTSNQQVTNNQPSKVPRTPIVQDGYDRFLTWFNSKVENTPIRQIRTLSDARKTAVRSIFKEFGGKDAVEKALDKVVQSQWCCGCNDAGWIASFDWIFKKSNFIKILEGNYDNRTRQQTRPALAAQANSYSELERAADAVLSGLAYNNAPEHD